MKKVEASNYYELRCLYPDAFAIRKDEKTGLYVGLIEEKKHEANARSSN